MGAKQSSSTARGGPFLVPPSVALPIPYSHRLRAALLATPPSPSSPSLSSSSALASSASSGSIILSSGAVVPSDDSNSTLPAVIIDIICTYCSSSLILLTGGNAFNDDDDDDGHDDYPARTVRIIDNRHIYVIDPLAAIVAKVGVSSSWKNYLLPKRMTLSRSPPGSSSSLVPPSTTSYITRLPVPLPPRSRGGLFSLIMQHDHYLYALQREECCFYRLDLSTLASFNTMAFSSSATEPATCRWDMLQPPGPRAQLLTVDQCIYAYGTSDHIDGGGQQQRLWFARYEPMMNEWHLLPTPQTHCGGHMIGIDSYRDHTTGATVPGTIIYACDSTSPSSSTNNKPSLSSSSSASSVSSSSASPTASSSGKDKSWTWRPPPPPPPPPFTIDTRSTSVISRPSVFDNPAFLLAAAAPVPPMDSSPSAPAFDIPWLPLDALVIHERIIQSFVVPASLHHPSQPDRLLLVLSDGHIMIWSITHQRLEPPKPQWCAPPPRDIEARPSYAYVPELGQLFLIGGKCHPLNLSLGEIAVYYKTTGVKCWSLDIMDMDSSWTMLPFKLPLPGSWDAAAITWNH